MKKNSPNPMTFERWVRTFVKEGTVTHDNPDGTKSMYVINHENIINYPEEHPDWVRIYEDYKTNN